MDFLDQPDKLSSRGYQSYVVLSLCRILYTLQSGDVASKPAAVRWAQATFGEPWKALIDDAWIGRQRPQMDADPDAVNRTLDFIRFAVDRAD
jgi:hypothetical protein